MLIIHWKTQESYLVTASVFQKRLTGNRDHLPYPMKSITKAQNEKDILLAVVRNRNIGRKDRE